MSEYIKTMSREEAQDKISKLYNLYKSIDAMDLPRQKAARWQFAKDVSDEFERALGDYNWSFEYKLEDFIRIAFHHEIYKKHDFIYAFNSLKSDLRQTMSWLSEIQ